jgi:hypothetical protein
VFTREPYVVDSALQANDRVAPSPFTEASAFAFRTIGTVCKGDTCTASTCGNSASIQLSFVAPSDDQTPSAELGYRIEVLAGEIPQSMLDDVGQPRPLPPSLSFDIGFDEVTRIDAVIALVAIDRAGNESAPSAPIAIRYSGCVKPFFEDRCLDPSDLGAETAGCSTSGQLTGRDASLPIAALALALAALALRNRKRGAAH